MTDTPAPAATLDALGLHCPVPVWQAAKRIMAMRPGEVLELLSDDPGIEEDIRAWCARTGQVLLSISRDGEMYRVLLQKSGSA